MGKANSQALAGASENADRNFGTRKVGETSQNCKDSSVNCAKVKKNYPVESYETQRENIKKNKNQKNSPYYKCQAHHVMQNAFFQRGRGKTADQKCCPDYSEAGALCIPLEDGMDPNTEHGRVTQMQKEDAKRYRQRCKNGEPGPTYEEARNDAKTQLVAAARWPRLSDAEVEECILKEVDKKFEEMCPKGMADPSKFRLRLPGSRGQGLPKQPLPKVPTAVGGSRP